MTGSKIDGFRLGIYVFEDAEVVDFAAPYGVLSVARRHDPAPDVFLAAEMLRPWAACECRFKTNRADHGFYHRILEIHREGACRGPAAYGSARPRPACPRRRGLLLSRVQAICKGASRDWALGVPAAPSGTGSGTRHASIAGPAAGERKPDYDQRGLPACHP
jgi:hypothetical protein